MRAVKKNNQKIKDSEPFKGLFTQGMVCHETYKDTSGKWLSPLEIEKKDKNNYVKLSDKTKVIVGPSESMSKSKKNVIDPESMIKSFGADAVRWFILSDSPPEKDVQWSNQGVNASHKFLQKLYNLMITIKNRPDSKGALNKEFEGSINNYIIKITNLIHNFQLNVAVANIYEIFNLFSSHLNRDISNACLKGNFINLMKILIPFTPHLANECLEQLNEKNMDNWPEIDKMSIISQKIKVAVQIDGKTREVAQVTKDLSENQFLEEIKKFDKISKYLKNNKIRKIIYVKNKIINILTK